MAYIVPWNSPDWNIGVGSLSLLQGIFPTQRSNPGLPRCRQILYRQSHQGSPKGLEITRKAVVPGAPPELVASVVMAMKMLQKTGMTPRPAVCPCPTSRLASDPRQ